LEKTAGVRDLPKLVGWVRNSVCSSRFCKVAQLKAPFQTTSGIIGIRGREL
jgi:hypothetical protein